MPIKDFIKTKQEGKIHSCEEINWFIKNLNSFSNEEIADWLRAVKANDLNDSETTTLTLAMANSGEILSWRGLEPVLDKHSTGGIGDKITFLFVPLIAAYGINIPKLSGRSLGITGGTIDKLESILGFRTSLSIEEIKEQVKKIKLSISGSSANLAPADKKIYAIRDVTGIVDLIPLLASSIMSKKIACGAGNIILDVKFGSGAFMKDLNGAKMLAGKMVHIGKQLDKKMKAVISNMNQPLGFAIGNVLEIKEVLEVLSGKEVQDLVEITISLAHEAISLINPKPELNLEKKLTDLLLRGEALKKFEDMVLAQGGDLKSVFSKDRIAKHIDVIKSDRDGYIQNIDARLIGEVVHALGAGRKSVTDKIDHSVGIVLHKKYGHKMTKGETILEIHAKNKEDSESVKEKLASAIKLGQNEPPKLKLIQETVN